MKQLKLLAMACGLLMVGACSSGGDDEPEVPTPVPTPTPTPDPKEDIGKGVVSFIPYLSAMTRATDTKFDKDDRIGVFAVVASGNNSHANIANSGNYADNVAYSYDGSKFVPVGAGIELKKDVKLYYTAVYPYQQNCANTFEFVVKENQSTGTNYTQSDLCTASTDATDAQVVDLRFSHRLSKIVINLTGDGWNSSNLTVKLKNVMTKTSVNLNNLNFVAIGEKKDITCASNGTRSFKVILPPQSVSMSEKLFVITMNGVDYTIDTQSKQEYNSGKSYEYTINMNADREIVEFTGDINPWNVDERINSVVPEDIQDKMEPYIPIYKGNTPPNIEGTVFVDPFSCVYCEDYGNGGFAPGTIVTSSYIRFSNQNAIYNTVDIDEVSVSGSSTSTGTGAFISGTGNNFTAFFNTNGQTDGISHRTALVISGTKTSAGIQNLKYAFIMVEKGSDPNSHLMNEGVFRVFEDQDGLSPYVSWPGASSREGMRDYREKSWFVFSNTLQ